MCTSMYTFGIRLADAPHLYDTKKLLTFPSGVYEINATGFDLRSPLRFGRSKAEVHRTSWTLCVPTLAFVSLQAAYTFLSTKKVNTFGIHLFSRCDRIRTCDLCVPNAALYQAEPRIAIHRKSTIRLLCFSLELYYHTFFCLSSKKSVSFKSPGIFSL